MISTIIMVVACMSVMACHNTAFFISLSIFPPLSLSLSLSLPLSLPPLPPGRGNTVIFPPDLSNEEQLPYFADDLNFDAIDGKILVGAA